MIKFFRKIRKKLIADKKVGNYILYALGEIFLVVVGILIALAINNYNEERIKKNKEQVYLKGLKEEFETSKFKLEELIRVNQESYSAAVEIAALMDQEKIPSESHLSELFVKAFAFDIFFNANNSLLNEMINSGSLKDISNDTLRIQLTNWIANIEDIAKQEKFQDGQRSNVIDIFRKQGRSIRTIMDHTGLTSELGLSEKSNPESNIEVLQSIDFENEILLFITSSKSTESEHYLPLLQHLNAILSLIDKEIDKKE